MRVFGWQTLTRNESEGLWLRCEPCLWGATSTDHDLYVKGLSKSISVGTRKMVNYA